MSLPNYLLHKTRESVNEAVKAIVQALVWDSAHRLFIHSSDDL